jgi:hypothetical protein
MRVTTVLNVYKRPELVLEQIECIKAQSVESDIWVDMTIPVDEDSNEYIGLATVIKGNHPQVKLNIHWNQNLYHFGRLYYAMNAQTDFVYIVDDDMFPGKLYLEMALEVFEKFNDCGAVCGYGVNLDRAKKGYAVQNVWGWHNLRKNKSQPLTTVDMGGHSWLMPTYLLRLAMAEQPLAVENGEDLFLSKQIQTIQSAYPRKVYCLTDVKGMPETYPTDPAKSWEVGNDEHATWRLSNHKQIRDGIVEEYKKQGWLA